MDKGMKKPREYFQRTLVKILGRCEAKRVYRVEWTDSLVPWEGRLSSEIELVKIWVVGSFARGALMCGDLDLILEIRVAAGRDYPPPRSIPRATFGVFPLVSVFIGTPQSNSSHVSFEDAVLVWDGVIDPADALAAIRHDADEGRFRRDEDIIPFRSDQVGDIEQIKKVVEGIQEGLYASHFVEFEDMVPPDDPSTYHRSLVDYLCGQKSREMLNRALAHLHSVEGLDLEEDYDWGVSKAELVGGGWSISTGSRPEIRLWRLDNSRWNCSALAILPFPTRRGPNGMWIIRPTNIS